MTLRSAGRIAWLATVAACSTPQSPAASASDSTIEWPHYGGDPGGMKYSPAAVVNRDNVGRLRIAWRVRIGDGRTGTVDSGLHMGSAKAASGASDSRFEATPIMRHRMLYVATPFNRALALDPSSGRILWTFDPRLDATGHYPEGFTSRGVALWTDTARSAGSGCAARVFLATVDARLIALDASSGVTCEDFGSGGTVHLARGAAVGGRDASAFNLSVTSPAAIAGDAVIVGSVVRESRRS